MKPEGWATRAWWIVPAAVLLALAAPVAAGDAGKTFMWRVDGERSTVHVIGSIHFMREDAYPLDPAIERAYTAAGTVVFETDLDELGEAAVAMLAAGTLDDDTTLAEVIGEPMVRDLELWLEDHGLGTAMFRRMRPWMVALTLTSLELQKGGYLGSEGIDAHFSARAAADGKRRDALEPVEFQVALFAEMTDSEGAEFLRYSLTELDTVIPLIDDIVAAWAAGDASKLEALLVEGFDEHPALFDKLVTDRNRRWLPKIEALLDADGDALVVVGALHLVGEQGIVELLKGKGYAVEQVSRLGGGSGVSSGDS